MVIRLFILDCKKFPGSSSGFATILKKNNTPIILVGARYEYGIVTTQRDSIVS